MDLYSLLGVESVADVVRCRRLRWFGHLERENGDDWVSAYRKVVVAGGECADRGRRTWGECVIWMSCVYTSNGWCSGIYGEASYREKRLTLAERGRNGRF